VGDTAGASADRTGSDCCVGRHGVADRRPGNARRLVDRSGGPAHPDPQIVAATDRPYCVNLVLAFDQRERLQLALEEAVPMVSFSWGVDEALIRQARDAGATVLVQVGGVDDAIRADAAGADVLIAQASRRVVMCSQRLPSCT
jgi:NAD(P)H-dependent flavin oxidoreductase YrpB (nitropropane dioxygenase family)